VIDIIDFEFDDGDQIAEAKQFLRIRQANERPTGVVVEEAGVKDSNHVEAIIFGTVPKGVSSPWGLTTRTTEPTVAPRLSAMSWPRTIGGMAATRCCTSARESARESGDDGVFVDAMFASAEFDCAITVLASSKGAAEPCFTELSKSPTLRS